MRAQRSLFESDALPAGFVHRPDFLSAADETALLADIAQLPLAEAPYRSYLAKRRIVAFGFGYDFSTNAMVTAPPLAPFLLPLRARLAAVAEIAADDFVQAVVTEYRPGTQLGWHRDVPQFGIIGGVSLGAAARMRLRPHPHLKHARTRALGIDLEPRSAYVMRDDARWKWQHAISPTKGLRYSITFRTLR